MTPEQKEAKRLVDSFETIENNLEIMHETGFAEPVDYGLTLEARKQCALKCVDEKLNEYEKLISIMPKNGVSPQIAARSIFNVRVKQEITKL